MNTLPEIIKNRITTRCFTNKKVDLKLVRKIIDIAKNCPTGGNMQPWNIAVVSGNTREKLSKILTKAFDDNIELDLDYDYYPTKFFPPFDIRRHFAGLAVYRAANIEFSDKHIDWQGVSKLIRENYNFFGADVGLIFYMDNKLTEGAHMDIALLMQNIMLLAEYFGLNTCPQASFINYSGLIKKTLNINPEMKIICGMSLGYADMEAPVNTCKTKKEAVDSFTTWHT